MKNLNTKDLVIRVTSEVQTEDLVALEVFQEKALEEVGKINTNLNTDSDFAQAKEDIKDCKTAETRLGQLAQDTTMSQEAVAKAMMILDQLAGKFRQTRLDLEKLVKKEETRRKLEIVSNGIADITGQVLASPLAQHFTIDRDAIKTAIKGKRSLEKMAEAVMEVVAEEAQRLSELEDLHFINMEKIVIAEKDFPGLFPDQKVLSLKPTIEVELTITSRIEKQKNDLREAEERRLEKERIDEERRLKEIKVKEEIQVEEEVSIQQKLPPLPEEIDLPLPPLPDDSKDHTIIVSVYGSKANAQKLVDDIGQYFPEVEVSLEE